MARSGPTSAFSRQFGRRLRALRAQLRPKLSVTALAVRSGVSVAYVSQLENGVRAPSLAVLLSLAGALRREPYELLLDPTEPAAVLLDAARRRDWTGVDGALELMGRPRR